MRRLKPGGWVGDSLINFVSERMQIMVGKTRLFCMSSQASADRIMLESDEVRRTLTNNMCSRYKIDPHTIEVVIIPIHVGETHWVVAMVSAVHKTVFVYDSLHSIGTIQKVGERVSTWYTDIFRNSTSTSSSSSSPMQIKVSSNLDQKDGVSCGVFVIMRVIGWVKTEAWKNTERALEPITTDPNLMRVKVAKMVMAELLKMRA